jgi:hypothetical protein
VTALAEPPEAPGRPWSLLPFFEGFFAGSVLIGALVPTDTEANAAGSGERTAPAFSGLPKVSLLVCAEKAPGAVLAPTAIECPVAAVVSGGTRVSATDSRGKVAGCSGAGWWGRGPLGEWIVAGFHWRDQSTAVDWVKWLHTYLAT